LRIEIKTQNPESEQYLIGAIFLDADRIDEIRVELTPQDFTNVKNRTIYGALLSMDDKGQMVKGQSIDLIILVDELKRRGELDKAGGKEYIQDIADKSSTSVAVSYHIEAIKKARAKREMLELTDRIKEDLKGGQDTEEILRGLQVNIHKMTTGGYIGIDPYEPLTKHLGDKYERDMAREPDKRLGYDLTKFEKLAKNIDGIQSGFYVVGAETNTGKTAFLCNLTLDLLNSNEGLTGIYFSLDDSKDVILNRFLSIKTGIPLNQVQRPQQTNRHKKMLMEGYGYLTKLVQDKRLFIRDSSEIQDIKALEVEIRRRMKGSLFVVIDALYNLDIGIDADQRRENIERADRLKALVNTYNIPIICTGELRKAKDRREHNKPPILDDLMETGKFAYNANLALLVYPDKWEDYDTQDEPVLIMKYAKNKLSHYRGIQKLAFTRMTGQLREGTNFD
jgi:replicative DNA helicase